MEIRKSGKFINFTFNSLQLSKYGASPDLNVDIRNRIFQIGQDGFNIWSFRGIAPYLFQNFISFIFRLFLICNFISKGIEVRGQHEGLGYLGLHISRDGLVKNMICKRIQNTFLIYWLLAQTLILTFIYVLEITGQID